MANKYSYGDIFSPLSISEFRNKICSIKSEVAGFPNITKQKVKQCNSCGAVGKINNECEYCGNTVY